MGKGGQQIEVGRAGEGKDGDRWGRRGTGGNMGGGGCRRNTTRCRRGWEGNQYGRGEKITPEINSTQRREDGMLPDKHTHTQAHTRTYTHPHPRPRTHTHTHPNSLHTHRLNT